MLTRGGAVFRLIQLSTLSIQATSDAKLIEKEDGNERTWASYSKSDKSKTSSEGTDAFAATLQTGAIMNNCQTSRESSEAKPGTSIIAAGGLKDMNKIDDASNGHHDSVLARNPFHENGYGSPPDKLMGKMKNDIEYFQYERRERPKDSESLVAVDYFPKDKGRSESDTRHCDAQKLKPTGENCSKPVNSHAEAKTVPLKPQRSKKSLNKENKDTTPQTHSWSDGNTCGAAGDVRMTKSSCDSERRLHDSTAPRSLALTQHQHFNNDLFAQPEPRDCRDRTGQAQWTRASSLHVGSSQNASEFSSKLPTAPPRSLPLKTQWSRDWPSNMDSSHIHYRLPSQETAKRKQAVNHLRPPLSNLSVHHGKVKHCMSFRR